jgi:uncharacterized protein (TIGR03435 family)
MLTTGRVVLLRVKVTAAGLTVAPTLPAGLPRAKPGHLQTLLAERFNLAVRKDTKAVPSYALRIGKRGQLKEAS